MCQPVRIVAKKVADGRKRVPEQVIPSPQVGVMGVGVVCPGANAPHLVKRAGFSKEHYQCRKGGVSSPGCAKTCQSPQRDGVFAFPLPSDLVETPDAPSDERLRLGFRPAQHELQRTVVVEEVRLCDHHKFTCTRIRNVVDGNYPFCPL